MNAPRMTTEQMLDAGAAQLTQWASRERGALRDLLMTQAAGLRSVAGREGFAAEAQTDDRKNALTIARIALDGASPGERGPW